jgi:hypothetical protein
MRCSRSMQDAGAAAAAAADDATEATVAARRTIVARTLRLSMMGFPSSSPCKRLLTLLARFAGCALADHRFWGVDQLRAYSAFRAGGSRPTQSQSHFGRLRSERLLLSVRARARL